jgi:protein TonB
MLPGTQRGDTLSVPALKLARPLYKQNTSPPYPRKARRLGYEGIVMLKVLIDENGRVDDLTVLQSSGHTILDRAASSAVKKWLFEPGTEGGIKKKMWVKIPVRFDLK